MTDFTWTPQERLEATLQLASDNSKKAKTLRRRIATMQKTAERCEKYALDYNNEAEKLKSNL